MTIASRAGKITYDEGRATLEFERLVPFSPERVWDALTNPATMERWAMTKATIDGRAGGAIDFWSGGGQVHTTGKILTWDPPRVFEHERNAEPGGWIVTAERSIIRWELTPHEGGTLLRLVHRWLPPTLAIKIAPATHVLLDRIEDDLAERASADFSDAVRSIRSLYSARTP